MAEITPIFTFDESSTNVRHPGYEVIFDFAEGRQYVQVNPGSRYAVEALAKFYKKGNESVLYGSGYTQDLAREIEERRTADPDSIAIFVRNDGLADVASVFMSLESLQ